MSRIHCPKSSLWLFHVWLRMQCHVLRFMNLLQKVCITIPNTRGAHWMNMRYLHLERLQKMSLKMRMNYAMCYDQFKHLVNPIRSDCKVRRLIFVTVVLWTPKKDRHAQRQQSENIPMVIVSRPLQSS